MTAINYNGPGGGGGSSGIENVVEDTTPQLGGPLDAQGNGIHFGTSETVNSASGTGASIDLGDKNHQTVDINPATGSPVTLTLTVPPGPGAGTIVITQGATARDITWSPSAGSVKWLGTEPTWTNDTNLFRIVSWRWDGTFLYLQASEANS